MTSSSPSIRVSSVARASTSARDRLVTSSSTRSKSVTPPSARPISVVVSRPRFARCSSSWRCRTSRYSRAFAIAIAAQSASTITALLVLVGELAAVLLRQVQVAPRLAVDQDRHAQERVHRGMRERETVRLRVRAHVGGGERPRLVDQDPETPRPCGRSPIALCVSSSIPRVRNRSSCSRRSSSTPMAA